ncbi:MAG: hypothetical protein L0J65_03380, partial [Alkalibacterium sp.]|nr:hypothetical protein [Alkalibacterium sp.]
MLQLVITDQLQANDDHKNQNKGQVFMKNKRIYLSIAVVLFLLFLLYIAWQLDSEKKFDVLILDKTVPDQTYQEHKGITWVLNHYKYLKNDGTLYDLAQDYSGFHPQEEKQYDISQLSENKKEYDLIYMADTYWIYENEYYDEKKEGTRSELIYGGLTDEEVAYIEEKYISQHVPVIAEFNSFASPTSPEVEQRLTSLLGIQWNGWSVRYFNELDPELKSDIPQWIIKNYEQQTNENWNLSGSGYVFVKNDESVLVLKEGQDFEGEGIRFEFNERGQEFFDTSLSSHYDYWFDIVESDSSEVLAEYSLGLTESGKQHLSDYDIENTFPAVTRNIKSKTPAYYFAGDYADMPVTPSIVRYKGMDWLNKMISRLQGNASHSFFYRAYLPMMNIILQEEYDEKNSDIERD